MNARLGMFLFDIRWNGLLKAIRYQWMYQWEPERFIFIKNYERYSWNAFWYNWYI